MTDEATARTAVQEGSANGAPRCPGRVEDGSACNAPPQFIRPSGWCWFHDPDNEDARMRASRLGGARTAAKLAKRKGLTAEELPPLNSPEAAETWAEVIGRAVAAGRISGAAASSALKAVREWHKAREAGEIADRLEALAAKLEGRSKR